MPLQIFLLAEHFPTDGARCLPAMQRHMVGECRARKERTTAYLTLCAREPGSSIWKSEGAGSAHCNFKCWWSRGQLEYSMFEMVSTYHFKLVKPVRILISTIIDNSSMQFSWVP